MTYTDISVDSLEDKIEFLLYLLAENKQLKEEVEVLIDVIRDLQWKLEGLQ